MEEYQKNIIQILNKSIRGEKESFKENESIAWKELIEEANKHEITALIYDSLERETLNRIDNELVYSWKMKTIESNINQNHYRKVIKSIIEDFNDMEIEIIILKGSVIKELYKKPELRTMSDFDILIRNEDYPRVQKYFIENGYEQMKSECPIHGVFYNEKQMCVEVHWKLVNEDFFNGFIDDFEEKVWENIQDVYIDNVKAKMLGNEDFILHLCIHMAVHMKYDGFGIRQIYDLAIFITKKYNNIKWMELLIKADILNVMEFLEILLILCNKIFIVKIPEQIKITNEKENYAKLLLDNILFSGVNGLQEQITELNSLLTVTKKYKISKMVLGIIFVNQKNLSVRYSYAKKHKFLLPFAWIHRMIYVILKRHDYIRLFKNINKCIKIGKKRSELVNKLNL